MRVLGVTGGTGTGKSTVCKILEEQGGVIIDADKIASSQQRKGCNAFNEIVSYFGEEILLPDGELNRTLLAGIVFSDNEKLRVLNSIVHKYVSLEMKERVARYGDENIMSEFVFDFDCDRGTVIVTRGEYMRLEFKLNGEHPNGLCYLHLQSAATEEDTVGAYVAGFRFDAE